MQTAMRPSLVSLDFCRLEDPLIRIRTDAKIASGDSQ